MHHCGKVQYSVKVRHSGEIRVRKLRRVGKHLTLGKSITVLKYTKMWNYITVEKSIILGNLINGKVNHIAKVYQVEKCITMPMFLMVGNSNTVWKFITLGKFVTVGKYNIV